MKRKTMKKRFLASALIFACAASMMAGCGSTKEEANDTAASASAESTSAEAAIATSDPTTDSGDVKTIKIASGQACSTMDVTNSYDGWYQVRYGLGQTLTKMNNDMTISGWLVEDDYSANEDYTEWTFTVKDGVTFSNGKACDGAAVKASLEYLFDHSERGVEYFTPASIEADGQKVIIKTEVAEPILPNKLADPLFTVVDATADDSNITEEGLPATGPFVLETYDSTTKECIVVRNENYWGGEVKADRIDFYFTEEQTVLTNLIQTGEVDAVYNLSMEFVGDYEGKDGYTLSRTASGRTTHGFMNQNGALGDKVLRQAILQNLDKETYCDVLLKGQYIAGKTLITASADYGYDELTDPNAYNPENAVKLLDDAGYVDIDGDGFRETPDGEQLDLKFTYYQGRPEQELLVGIVAQDMAKIGIKITIDLKDSETTMKLLASGEYDLLCMSINVLNCADPENHMKTYFGGEGSYSTTGWDSKEYDKIMEKLEKTADPADRRSLVMEAEQMLLDDGTAIFFCYPLMNFVMKDTVTGLESTPADYYWVNETTYME